MEDSKKKPIMIAVIVVCLILAVVITFATRSGDTGGIDDLKRGVMFWVKCSNPDCEHTWQMDRKDYFQYLRDHQDPMSMAAPAIVCEECSEESGYRAEKCGQCGLVFERGSVPHDFADRCPECGYSNVEDMRKKGRQAEREEEE
jgi:ssDNA-binding Zn-finger/Zn-ribbon topoisomerase 1